ncbi:MAG: hypothetical protein R3D57_06435 [Hyphomicrobiaceae bacterium]
MRSHYRAALALIALMSVGIPPVVAQEGPPAEIALSEETLKAVIAATKEMQALDPNKDGDGGSEAAEQTTEVDGELDAIAKKHGFADGEAYSQAFESAVQAFAVVDWTSEQRKQEAAAEIEAIKADPDMSEEAKQGEISQIEQDLAAPPPTALPENVELVKAHEAEMRELMSSDIGP